MKRISFIITYYNESTEILKDCVQSVLSLPLTPQEREILLIDDGSSIAAPECPGVTVFRQETQGLSAARNKGIELAQGEYIQFLDADDFLLPAYHQVLELQENYQPDMLMFDFTRSISKEESVLKGVELFNSGADLLKVCNMHASAWGYLFRRSILADLRFHPGILHEDELFTPQLLLKAGKVAAVKLPAYYYRIGADTITHLQDAVHIQKRLNDTLFILLCLDQMAQHVQGKEQEALQRRVAQLSMDYIYDCWMLTRSSTEVLSCLRSLKDKGLYPLPLRCYTLKYWIFAITINSLCVFL